MNKKEIVIEKARDLFRHYGYKKVSMDEVAKEANVTKKTIYTYFKDKEDLFKYFIKEELDIMREEINKQEKSDMSFISIVSSNIYLMLKFRNDSDLCSNIRRDNNESFLKIYDDEIIKYLEEKIDNACQNGVIKKCDSHLTAFVIYKVCMAVMFEYDREIEEERVAQEITSILKNGLLN